MPKILGVMPLRLELKPDQKQQNLCFELLLCGMPLDLLSFFETTSPLSKDEEAAGVVPVVGSSAQTPSTSSGVLSGAEEGVPERPCTRNQFYKSFTLVFYKSSYCLPN